MAYIWLQKLLHVFNLLPYFFFIPLRIDHLETIQQLLTAVVKKIPLITAKSKTITLNIGVHFLKL